MMVRNNRSKTAVQMLLSALLLVLMSNVAESRRLQTSYTPAPYTTGPVSPTISPAPTDHLVIVINPDDGKSDKDSSDDGDKMGKGKGKGGFGRRKRRHDGKGGKGKKEKKCKKPGKKHPKYDYVDCPPTISPAPSASQPPSFSPTGTPVPTETGFPSMRLTWTPTGTSVPSAGPTPGPTPTPTMPITPAPQWVAPPTIAPSTAAPTALAQVTRNAACAAIANGSYLETSRTIAVTYFYELLTNSTGVALSDAAAAAEEIMRAFLAREMVACQNNRRRRLETLGVGPGLPDQLAASGGCLNLDDSSPTQSCFLMEGSLILYLSEDSGVTTVSGPTRAFQILERALNGGQRNRRGLLVNQSPDEQEFTIGTVVTPAAAAVTSIASKDAEQDTIQEEEEDEEEDDLWLEQLAQQRRRHLQSGFSDPSMGVLGLYFRGGVLDDSTVTSSGDIPSSAEETSVANVGGTMSSTGIILISLACVGVLLVLLFAFRRRKRQEFIKDRELIELEMADDGTVDTPRNTLSLDERIHSAGPSPSPREASPDNADPTRDVHILADDDTIFTGLDFDTLHYHQKAGSAGASVSPARPIFVPAEGEEVVSPSSYATRTYGVGDTVDL